MAILSINAGSSSLKFSVHPLAGGQVQPCVMGGCIEGLQPGGEPRLSWTERDQSEAVMIAPVPEGDVFEAALRALSELLAQHPDIAPIEAIAHRVVHGGQDHVTPVRVTEAVLQRLERLNSLAPLHQPHNLQGIRAFQQVYPGLPQIACFDTAFHATLAPDEWRFALPQVLTDQGVRRYGFHGLSYHYIMGQLLQRSPRAQGRVLMAHLGNGASLCAAWQGRSCATTMGFSAVEGLMMGTRSGSLDPGVLLYLLEQGWDHERLQTLLYRQSGLLGVSGLSADMRVLRQDGGPAAAAAIALFTHRVVREAGAMVACLQGLDLLAFSGGIGEHDAALRAQVCERLAWLGVRIDDRLNRQAVGTQMMAVHSADSTVDIWVVPTDEGRVAAQLAAGLLTAQA